MENNLVESWLDLVSENEWVWYAKRLSANDTGATNSHQAGIYIPKPVLWLIFPSMKTGSNPEAWFTASIMPINENRSLRAIWYNRETRNESRVTQWNRPSRILHPDLTGAIVLFAFKRGEHQKNSQEAAVWVCQNETEEKAIEDLLGSVEPGEGIIHYPGGNVPKGGEPLLEPISKGCALSDLEIPQEWLSNFPTGQVFVEQSILKMPSASETPDKRLIIRRDCEAALFYSVERASVLPRIKAGFENVSEFIDFANSVTNRRKSRAGKSLELHLKTIFREEELSFSHGEISEGNKKPDFLFPHINAYRDESWPGNKLRMLASKTTCKDRWRQILNEADRIPFKHLITLQQGVSVNQFKEMTDAGVILVVPKGLQESYPESIRPKLLTLEDFITETRSEC